MIAYYTSFLWMMAAAGSLPLPASSFAPVGKKTIAPTSHRVNCRFAVSSELQNNEGGAAASAAEKEEEEDTTILSSTPSKPPHRRRERYSGRYPRNFKHKYKERSGDEETMEKVLAKGMTPAGTHVPIMVEECLHYMGLNYDSSKTKKETDDEETKKTQQPPLLVVDCTLGYGGHSSYILKHLVETRKDDGSSSGRLIAFDRDSIEIKKTEERLRNSLRELIQSTDDPTMDIDDAGDALFTAVNQNFRTVGTYLSSTDQNGKVTNLLADLGLSSMQIDDNDRGFTYKREGPLDMRMNPEDDDATTETAHDLLKRLRVRKLRSMLRENSDEEFAAEIAAGLVGKGATVPKTTTELADRVREIVRPLMEKQQYHGNKKITNNHERKKTKRQLDSTVARVMQAIRIEVNGEFEALERLLEDLPKILAPGGRAVFLTFHSGEDRRVKKSLKGGFQRGVYRAWSRDVVRPSKEERRNNPRSSCCKLRWAVRSEDEE